MAEKIESILMAVWAALREVRFERRLQFKLPSFNLTRVSGHLATNLQIHLDC